MDRLSDPGGEQGPCRSEVVPHRWCSRLSDRSLQWRRRPRQTSIWLISAHRGGRCPSWASLHGPTKQVVVGTFPGPGQVQSVGQEPARSSCAVGIPVSHQSAAGLYPLVPLTGAGLPGTRVERRNPFHLHRGDHGADRRDARRNQTSEAMETDSLETSFDPSATTRLSWGCWFIVLRIRIMDSLRLGR